LQFSDLTDNLPTKSPAYNVRFGATAAVTPQKLTCEHERQLPAERAVKAAATPSRCLDVRGFYLVV